MGIGSGTGGGGGGCGADTSGGSCGGTGGGGANASAAAERVPSECPVYATYTATHDDGRVSSPPRALPALLPSSAASLLGGTDMLFRIGIPKRYA